ncbi:MAG: hypothetical protein ABJH44_09725 [Balneola sp.]
MISGKWKYILLNFLCLLVCYGAFSSVNAQSASEDDTEVYLSFSYRSAINSVVISYYKNDTFYIPYTELFKLLEIDNNVKVEDDAIILSGKFLQDETPYQINLNTYQASFGSKKSTFTSNDFLIKELDYYLEISIFQELFGLNFEVDFNNLALVLETEREIPIVQKLLRQYKRQQISRNERISNLNYPLEYERDRKILGAGFLDYNLSAVNNDGSNIFLFNSSIGAEALGGDVQGTINGVYSTENSNVTTNNLRWRYAVTDNPIISSVTAGQTSSSGILGNPYTGVKITNQPIEPRRLYDEFVVQGNTLPRSEVELYINNVLADFQETDATGNYRFLTPLTYGTSSYDLKIFGPTGQVIERSKRIQVPFSFLPPGEVNYNIDFGELENPLVGTQDRGLMAQGNAMIGISNWLTARAGVEYFESLQSNKPTFTGGFSARILNKYLITTELANDAFVRTRGSVIFGNASSLSLSYTDYFQQNRIYNSGNFNKELQASLFYPFLIGAVPLNIRLFGSRIERSPRPLSRYRIDVSSRIQRFNLRAGFSNSNTETDFLKLTDNASLSFSATYNFPRLPETPTIFHGMFARGEISFLPTSKELEDAQVFVSRNVFTKGSVQLSFTRNFRFGFNTISASIVVDFNKARVNSRFRNIRSSNTLTSTIRGSIGYDSNNNNILLTSRNQVGRSASAVRLFVDYDGDEKFSEGDEIIKDNAIRLDRTGTTLYKDGITYITQMQPYFKYNMEINKGAIKNPLLVPQQEKFGVISDPNFFKPIDIPFYSSGIIEGVVDRRYDSDNQDGIGGIRLYLKDIEKNTSQELRTFSDGSFYSYEIPPGNYELSIDPSQLEILESKSFPSKIDIEIEALADGDFVEGLSFLIAPENFDPDKVEAVPTETIIAEISNSTEILEFEAELDKNVNGALRFIILAQTAFYNRDIEKALSLVNQSLDLFETAQGYALKGSLNYLKGNRIEAQKNWESATQFNPDIIIPDIEVLDQIIRTQLGD